MSTTHVLECRSVVYCRHIKASACLIVKVQHADTPALRNALKNHTAHSKTKTTPHGRHSWRQVHLQYRPDNSVVIDAAVQTQRMPKRVLAAKVVDYKGVQGLKKYIPYSEYATMRFGDGRSAYWNAATMRHLQRHLDLPLETALGYFYSDMFNRWAGPGA